MDRDPNEPCQSELFRSFMIEECCAFSRNLALNFIAETHFCLKTIEKFIEKEKSHEIKLLKNEADRLPEKHRGNFWADYYPIHWENIFETQLRSSFIVSLASFIEDYIKRIAWEVSIIQRIDKDPRTWSRNILQRLRKYLREHGGFSKPGEEHWNFLYSIYRLRNVFVHNGGHLNAPRKYAHLESFIASETDITESNGFITIESAFCFRALESVEQAISALQQEEIALCKRSVA